MHDLQSYITYETHTEPKYPYRPVAAILFYSTALCLTFLSALVAKTLPIPAPAKPTPRPVMVLHAVSTPPTRTQSPSPTATPTIVDATDRSFFIQQREAIKQYIKTIFGPNAPTAIAIATAESGKVDTKTGKPYFATYAVHKSEVETSVGLFQINLKSKEVLVHWAMVPGQTEDEKIEWLKNPYNNTLFAFWVYSTSSFHPWSVFTDGTYLAYVKR